MWKPVIFAIATLVAVGLTIVHAQQRDRGRDDDVGVRFEYRHRISAEDMAAFADARIAALKAGLELTSDQAQNWSPFEQALREMVQLRIQRKQAREVSEQSHALTAPFERLTRRADDMAKTSAALKRIADTGNPLYESLSDAQRARFKKLARMLWPHHHGMHAWNRDDGTSDQGSRALRQRF
jgi:hypothetical protein